MSNINIIDTHCHIYADELADRLPQVVQHAKEQGISYIMMPNVDGATIEVMLQAEKNHDVCLPMMGLHPCSVDAGYKEALKEIDDWFQQRNFYGVGETGIDLYWDKTWIQEQKICFDHQIMLARDTGLPVIIHSRDSLPITIDMIRQRQDGNLKGIFHCFTGTLEEAKEIIDLGFYLGIGGVITYKNANLPDVIKEIKLENIVLETDAPYLPPVPHRGKKNEPAFLIHILDKIAQVLEMEKADVASITTKNAILLFALSSKSSDS